MVLGAEPRFHFELVMVRGMVSVRLVGFGPLFLLCMMYEVLYVICYQSATTNLIAAHHT